MLSAIRSLIRSTRTVFLREITLLSRRPFFLMLLTVFPAGLFLLFALIYSRSVVTEIPMAVLDADHSALSLTLIRSMDATRSIALVRTVDRTEEIEELMKYGTVQGAIVIPKDFERNIKKGKQTTVTVYKNSFNLIIGNSLLKDASTVVKTISAGVLLKKFRSAGMMEDQAMALANPIRLDTSNLYDPYYNYETYFVPCLIMAMFQMLVMVTAVVPYGGEKESGSHRELHSNTDLSPAAVLFGKSLPYLLLHMVTTLFILVGLFTFFGIPIHGSGNLLFLYVMIGNGAVFFLGFLASIALHGQIFATEVMVFLGTPAMLFSGYTFPVEAMPASLVAMAHVIPFTTFFSGFVKIYQEGAPLAVISSELMTLTALLIVTAVASWWMIRRQMRARGAQ